MIICHPKMDNLIDFVISRHRWDKVFKSGLSKFCRRQLSKTSFSPILNTLSHFFLKTTQLQKNLPFKIIDILSYCPRCSRSINFPPRTVMSKTPSLIHETEGGVNSMHDFRKHSTNGQIKRLSQFAPAKLKTYLPCQPTDTE